MEERVCLYDETRRLLELFCEENFENFELENYQIDGSVIKLSGSRWCGLGENGETDNAWTESATREIDLLRYWTWLYLLAKKNK
ncbi:MAG: hypothetical protein ACKVTZ_06060 [Bacteroidia bacterium]